MKRFLRAPVLTRPEPRGRPDDLGRRSDSARPGRLRPGRAVAQPVAGRRSGGCPGREPGRHDAGPARRRLPDGAGLADAGRWRGGGRCRRPAPATGAPIRSRAGAVLVAGGLLAMVVGGGALLGRQQAEQTWSETEEAARAARQVAAPTPRWLDEPALDAGRRPIQRRPPRRVRHRPPPHRPPSTPTPAAPPQVVAEPTIRAWHGPKMSSGSLPLKSRQPTSAPSPSEPPADVPSAEPTPGPNPRASADAVEILGSEFRFLDPPEPGAQAIIGLQVRNHADLPTGRCA